MSSQKESFVLNRVPSVGLGTYAFEQNKDSNSEINPENDHRVNSAETIVYHAVGHAGYRHIDTAYVYNNEKEIGQGLGRAMKDFEIPR